MESIKDRTSKVMKSIKGFSTKRKLLVLIIVWILIFVPAIIIYNSTQSRDMFSYYPESSAPFDKENREWDVSLYANGSEAEFSKSEDRYVISVDEGKSINFTWRAENFHLSETAELHIGQIGVHYNTTWGEEGTIFLDRVDDGNVTWEGEKAFQDSGDVFFYYRVDKRDIARYHRRASVLLQGGNLYEDTTTDPPPLINFLFIPPTLLSFPVTWGGYYLSFYIYFSLFILLGGILLFYTFKDWGEEKAFALSILYIINPISLTTMIQDESVVAFIIILTVFVLIRGKEKLGALTIGLGSVTKVWSGFFIPAQLFDRNIRFKKRIQSFIIAVSAIGGIFSFFYFIWGPKVFFFLRFYGGAAEKFRFRDISIWKSAYRLPVSIPLPSTTTILISLVIIELIVLYIAYKKRWDTISIFTVTLFIFMLFYPKMHLDFYLILLPTLLFYSVRNRRNFKLFIAFYGFLIMSRAVRYLPTGPYEITTWISFVAGVSFTLIGLKIISLFFTDYKITKYFTDISKM